jgi:hypothetical protein
MSVERGEPVARAVLAIADDRKPARRKLNAKLVASPCRGLELELAVARPPRE